MGEVDGLEAPWGMASESVVAFVPRQFVPGDLPGRIRPLPGPGVLVAERGSSSPVGRYVALETGVPARLGARPGLCFTTVVTDSAPRRAAGQRNWGFPGEVATLTWRTVGDRAAEIAIAERDVLVAATWSARALPFVLSVRALAHRVDGDVVVPARLTGWARPATVTIEAPDGDPLSAMAGEHRGVRLGRVRMLVRPARHPAGMLSSLVAPLRPEASVPGVPGMGGVPAGPASGATLIDPRAYGSVG